MHGQDYTYAKNLKTQKTEHKQEIPNSNTLECLEPKKNYILLGKHA